MSSRSLASLALVFASLGCHHAGARPALASQPAPDTVRVATFNVEDVRTVDLLNPDQPRIKKIAAEIAEMHPDILLINEIQYDGPGDPWKPAADSDGMNAKRLVENFVNKTSAASLHYRAFMRPSNTGIASGFDFDNDGAVSSVVPELPPGGADGSPGRQTPEGRAYGGDAYGFGMFPGEYGMALLVRSRYRILVDSVRTFQKFLWKDLPGALAPIDPKTGKPWYSKEEWQHFRLSSKSHWDVPIELPDGKVIHILASHPTPPAFDGPEKRNHDRNHDEIRFWHEYLADAPFIVDDQGRHGGLGSGASFVILGDLNSDAAGGDSVDNPVQKYLIDDPRVNGAFVPQADQEVEGMSSYATIWWMGGRRVDYVLPSTDLRILDGAVHRQTTSEKESTSDHFPVWVDIVVN